jgi:hypothetical protein
MESMRKIAGLAVAFWLMSAGGAYAITWELSGKLSISQSPDTPQALMDLEGTSFTAYLTYDENASPTSTWSEGFANYANQGSFIFNTALGTASGNFDNLQTFIFNGVFERGSNFNGGGSDLILTGPISSLSVAPTSFDFQFHQISSDDKIGLTSFALPTEINLENFNGANFVRFNFSSPTSEYWPPSLIGTIASISPIPEPHVYAMMLAGFGLLGLRMYKRS